MASLLWVRGGPEPVHDVDFVVAEEDADTAAKTLGEAGFRIDRPPEDWLFKACIGDVVVDVLHRLNGVPVDPSTIRGADDVEVLAIAMPVLPPTQVVSEKLTSLNEHHCDFAALLPGVRAVLTGAEMAADAVGAMHALWLVRGIDGPAIEPPRSGYGPP